MNLSVLERMVREGDMSADGLRYLLDCRGECEWLDYKVLLHLDHESALGDFGRDVLGMKNVGGGYIVVGVEDKSWKPLGLDSRLPFDSKLLRDKVRRATGTEIEVDIVHHEVQAGPTSRVFALILIRGSKKRKKRRTPTVVEKDFVPSKPYGLRRGEIYIRHGDSTVLIKSREELEELLDGLDASADQDAFSVSGSSSPFAIEDGTYRLLEKGFHRFIGRENLRQELMVAITQDPRIWIINVHGPGGVGKSALVNWVVYEFYREKRFEAILQVTAKETVLTAEGIERFSRSLYSLENLLDHILNTFQEPAPTELAEKKTIATEILSAWKTLLVLDNMESVSDGRIISFIQSLPPETRAKVLMTSRQRSGGWELPVPVSELLRNEVKDFMLIKAGEMSIPFLLDEKAVDDVWKASGGLPLAIQWILGRAKKVGKLEPVLAAVGDKDSPVLEFSFGNIWKVLSNDAKAILATTTIFDEPPTTQQLAIATEFGVEKIERALAELAEVTLVTRSTQVSDGTVRFVALPITLSFARNQLHAMGDFEVKCRQRFQKFNEQMALQESEVHRFRDKFERFGLETDNEKRAAILCQRGQSEMFIGNTDTADTLFKQACDLAPQSAYVHALTASYHLARNRLGAALEQAHEACARSTKKTGALCYTIKARVLDIQRDRAGRVTALEKALEFDPEDAVTRHQYGVALSRAGRPEAAIEQFTKIIEKEKGNVFATAQMLMALKTRMINLKRLGRDIEFREDLALVSQLFVKNPHLSGEAEEFAEFSVEGEG